MGVGMETRSEPVTAATEGSLLAARRRFKLAFLVFINQFFKFFAEYSAVVAAHLGAADKTRFIALNTDHAGLLMVKASISVK